MTDRLRNLLHKTRELARRRGAVLPEPEELADAMLLLLGREGSLRILDENPDGHYFGPIAVAVMALPVEPAAEAVRGGVCDVLRAVAGQDARAYKCALQGLLVRFPGRHGWEAVMAAAKSLRPRPPAPVGVARAEPDAVEVAAIAKARGAGRPEPEAVSLGEKIAVACEAADPATEEVVVRRRLPGEGPYYPEGVPRHSDNTGWKPLTDEGLYDWEGNR